MNMSLCLSLEYTRILWYCSRQASILEYRTRACLQYPVEFAAAAEDNPAMVLPPASDGESGVEVPSAKKAKRQKTAMKLEDWVEAGNVAESKDTRTNGKDVAVIRLLLLLLLLLSLLHASCLLLACCLLPLACCLLAWLAAASDASPQDSVAAAAAVAAPVPGSCCWF